MKKLFTAVPMKKLLLATSIVAMSSTALAAGNTSPLLDTAITDTLTVTAKYVTPIALGLDTSSINFGDVWSDSVIPTEPVIATVTGEAGETFTYSVTATADAIVLLTGDISGVTVPFGASGEVTKALTFNVGLNTSGAGTGTIVSETVTISVNYDAIADTTVTPVT
jgi:hypothetical protein